VVRSDSLDELSARGWDAVVAHGIRTIIDLRNDDERPERLERPNAIETLHLPLDNIEDHAFWNQWNSGWECGTPLYYTPHIARFPKRSARVLQAIARAPAGGVVVHCVGGRDRTGLVCMLLLALVGVGADDIASDYALSRDRLAPLFARRGEPDQGPLIDAFLAEVGASAPDLIRTTLGELDLGAFLAAGGVGESDVAALRARMLSAG
jgi:protein tyrosine/serine phosphatase